jgi:uncharacterized membrane protein
MAKNTTKTDVCQICGKSFSRAALVPASIVRSTIVEHIRTSYPNWSTEGFICRPDLNRFRTEHIQSLLESERGELTNLEKEVAESLLEHEILSRNVDEEFSERLSFGERLSDHLASFGGSWTFIILFAVALTVWMTINTALLGRTAFDPYPYILLNLVLSCLAAIQAPVIMMTQNRQEAKDRLRSQHDYQINMKAELEIRQLHEKIDHLLSSQWQRLVEIQQVQVELLDELGRTRGH